MAAGLAFPRDNIAGWFAHLMMAARLHRCRSWAWLARVACARGGSSGAQRGMADPKSLLVTKRAKRRRDCHETKPRLARVARILQCVLCSGRWRGALCRFVSLDGGRPASGRYGKSGGVSPAARTRDPQLGAPRAGGTGGSYLCSRPTPTPCCQPMAARLANACRLPQPACAAHDVGQLARAAARPPGGPARRKSPAPSGRDYWPDRAHRSFDGVLDPLHGAAANPNQVSNLKYALAGRQLITDALLHLAGDARPADCPA
jgi:hypothetical protein